MEQGASHDLAATRVDDRLVVIDRARVRVFAAESGEPLWTHDRGEQVCDQPRVSDAGDVVLVDGETCHRVRVLDGSSGEVRWQRRMPVLSERYDVGGVTAHVGESTVTVVEHCDQVTRLSLADGSEIEVLNPYDRKCANDATTDGRLLVLWSDPETADTPDDHGTGMVPPHESEGVFSLRDADTGGVLWRLNADGGGSGLLLPGLISADPVVVAMEVEGERGLRRLTPGQDGPGDRIGQPLEGWGEAFRTVGQLGDVVLGSYGTSAELVALDLTAGKDLWRRDGRQLASRMVLGPTGADLLVLRLDAYHVEGEGTGVRQWLHHVDGATGEDRGTSGWVDAPFGTTAAVVADDLLVHVGDDLQVFEIGAPDEDSTDLWDPPR